MKKMVLASVLLLGACGHNQVDAEGFADLKFGMTPEQLRPFGFSCGVNEADCKQTEPVPAAGRASLFEKPVRLALKLVGGALTEIDVMLPNYSDDELIELYQKAFGDAKSCRFNNAVAATVEKHVWMAKNGATITVSKILDYGTAPNLSSFGGLGSFATYRDPVRSAEFKKVSC